MLGGGGRKTEDGICIVSGSQMMGHEGAMEPQAFPGPGVTVGDTGGVPEERNTRASRWSMNETLELIAAKKKEMEEDRDARLRGKITHDSKKWSSIAQFCNLHGVHRDSSQCKKRWHSLFTEYRKIKDYEREGNPVSYWLMSADKRRETNLAPMFERDVFNHMDNFLSGPPNVFTEITCDSGVPAPIVGADLDGPEHSQGSSMEMGGLRSGAVGSEKNHRASRWTVHETSVLIAAKKREADDETEGARKGRTVQDSKKWAAIARFCNEQGVNRDSMQCKKRWHNLYTEYKKIRDHESISGVESYWVLSVEKRRKSKLARMFEREVYDYMDDFLSQTPKVVPISTFENGRPPSVRDPAPPRDPLPEVGENNSAPQDSLLEGGGLGSTAFDTVHARKRQRRRLLSRDDVSDHKLVSVLESNGKAMQAELAADRELRKEQGANLIAVFDKLADGLGQIASAIHNLQK